MKPTCRVRQRASSLSDISEMTFVADGDRAGGGLIEPGDQVQKRRLARTRRPHEREELGLADIERQIAQHVDRFGTASERLVQIANLNQARAIGRVPVWRRRC